MAKPFLFTLGVISLILGAIGAFLPLLPTTPFVLLAAWCFLKSSARAHAWLYRQPLFGPALRDWEQKRAISLRTKAVALTTICLSLVSLWLKVKNLYIAIGVTALLVCVSLFIATRKNN